MNRREQTHRRIDREIREEKAAARGRAGERLTSALEAVAALGRRLDAAVDATEEHGLLAEYEAARHRAQEARLALPIQREAVGLRRHVTVDQQFPEPPRRRPRHPR